MHLARVPGRSHLKYACLWAHRVQVHGFPRVMGVLTHLDTFKEQSHLKKAKKALKVRQHCKF